MITHLMLTGTTILTSSLAEGFTAPNVPESGKALMPNASTLSEGLSMILQDVIPLIRPDLYEASKVCLAVIAAVMITSVIQSFSKSQKEVCDIVGTASIAATLLLSANSMIRLGSDTVVEMTEYGKLLIPVMTAALAAQGAIGTSAALYTATMGIISLIGTAMSKLLLPMIYLFLALAIASGATGQDMLKQFRNMMKDGISWFLKTVLTIFTTYMGLTGIISGTTDNTAAKITKAAISSAVPVVGGILSDASESVLASAAMTKNAVGLYGLFAILAVFLNPFIKIGCHYLLLKATGAVCAIFGSKTMTELIGDFSTAMGLLLGITGSVCLLLLISTICFIRGVS